MRAFAFAPLVAFALAGTSCGGLSSLREPDDYQGCATDENWKTFDDYQLTGRVTLDDALAPKLGNLTAGMALPASPAYKFEWQLSPSVPGKSGGTATCAQCPTCGGIGGMHLPPVSGDLYDLQFSSNGSLVWRALTTMQAYTPTQVGWSRLVGKPVSLRITRIGLKDNDVTEGPFQPAKLIDFTVGK